MRDPFLCDALADGAVGVGSVALHDWLLKSTDIGSGHLPSEHHAASASARLEQQRLDDFMSYASLMLVAKASAGREMRSLVPRGHETLRQQRTRRSLFDVLRGLSLLLVCLSSVCGCCERKCDAVGQRSFSEGCTAGISLGICEHKLSACGDGWHVHAQPEAHWPLGSEIWLCTHTIHHKCSPCSARMCGILQALGWSSDHSLPSVLLLEHLIWHG